MEPHDKNKHAQLLLDSFRKVTGRSLWADGPGGGVGLSAAERLDSAPVAVLSHGTESDPVLNYGNRTALELWEMDWGSFTSMPSRLTAEPMQREERGRLLDEVRARGYSEGYSGIRITGTGRRFRIVDAIVWNVVDGEGVYRGQAAAIYRWGDAEELLN